MSDNVLAQISSSVLEAELTRRKNSATEHDRKLTVSELPRYIMGPHNEFELTIEFAGKHDGVKVSIIRPAESNYHNEHVALALEELAKQIKTKYCK